MEWGYRWLEVGAHVFDLSNSDTPGEIAEIFGLIEVIGLE